MKPFDAGDARAITALRVLSIDQVERAKSGHPGLPLGVAPMAWVLWSRFLRHDPSDPGWPDRDRFVLSAGHGSALLYSLLHLHGYDLSIDELQRFRQLGSRTPGHPEYGHVPGVETTTGPLGQGLATAVGMALAERHLAAVFNREGHEIVSHRTYVIASDGDMMEGISHEAASLAGHLRLGKLVVLYDDNHISIEGPTEITFTDDTEARFLAYGWKVDHVDDGNDSAAIAAALTRATASEDAPTLIRVRTHIGYGSPNKQDTADAHGSPLGPEEAAATRRALGWDDPETFAIPEAVYETAHASAARGREDRRRWEELWRSYEHSEPALASELARRWRGELPAGWEESLPVFEKGGKMATRQASGAVINGVATCLPELVGGSADLSPSNDTVIKGNPSVAAGAYGGRNIHFGVREHAMAAAANGMSLHGGLRPYAGTFLIFSDYMRPAIRLAALMQQPVIYVFTHDSVHLGEDGPTHQPVEQLVSLRLIPNMVLLRPADANETAAAWRVALLRRDGPTALALTRQKMPVLPPPPPDGVARGAYIREEASGGVPTVVLLATGSEVTLALAVRDTLEAEGVPTRVVSVPSLELLARQDDDYRRRILGPQRALRVSIELGRGQGWHKWVGDGELISLSRFGESAPGEEVAAALGFSAEAITTRIKERLESRGPSPLAIAASSALEGVTGGKSARLQSLHALGRVAIRDASLWGERSVGDVCRRLGWLDLPSRTRRELDGHSRLASDLAHERVRTLYLLGMGGSALAPRVLREIGGAPSGRELVVLDTTDPTAVRAVLASLDVRSSAVLAVSKSGATLETTCLLEVFWEVFHRILGDDAGRRFLASTEHGTPLEQLATERSFRSLLPHPVDVGGRFAALSSVGVFPAVWLGQDAEALLRGGEVGLSGISMTHPAIELATLLSGAAGGGFGILAWCSSPGLRPLGPWMEQLVAESTGKNGKGILPVLPCCPPGPGHAWDPALVVSPRFDDEDTVELDRSLDVLSSERRPVVRWRLRRDRLGEAFTVLELATALAAVPLGINPFDEPDVARAKERARSFLSHRQHRAEDPTTDPAGTLLRHVDSTQGTRAVALLAYLPETETVTSLLERLTAALAARTGVPVTYGFGPRYLHSTGQLHKGGPAGVVPIVLTSPLDEDVSVPGRRFTLGALRSAQARGDVAALEESGRPVLHLHLGDPEGDLEAMLAATS